MTKVHLDKSVPGVGIIRNAGIIWGRALFPNVYLQPHYGTLVWQCGFRQCLPFSWTTLRGKHCRHPIAVMGIVDTFRHMRKLVKFLIQIQINSVANVRGWIWNCGHEPSHWLTDVGLVHFFWLINNSALSRKKLEQSSVWRDTFWS